MEKKCILCVDDEKIILNSIKTQLKKNFDNEFLFETAENAYDAMELIDDLVSDNVDILIIVSDWLMPGIKGDEFLIQVHKKYPQIVKVLLTGQADNIAIERTQKFANLHKCLYKPWNERELIEAIKTGINKL